MIRRAEQSDLKQIGEIYNYEILNGTSTFDTETKDEKYFLEWFKAHEGKYRIIVYEKDKVILGYASLSVYNARGAFSATSEISVYVKKNSRGKGIGTALMSEILREAKNENSFSAIISQITGDNIVSRLLHETFGFQFVGRLKKVGFKFGKPLDLDIYQLMAEKII